MSKVYAIKTIQTIPVSLDAAWDFFSSPANLKEITPDNLGFNITECSLTFALKKITNRAAQSLFNHGVGVNAGQAQSAPQLSPNG